LGWCRCVEKVWLTGFSMLVCSRRIATPASGLFVAPAVRRACPAATGFAGSPERRNGVFGSTDRCLGAILRFCYRYGRAARVRSSRQNRGLRGGESPKKMSKKESKKWHLTLIVQILYYASTENGNSRLASNTHTFSLAKTKRASRRRYSLWTCRVYKLYGETSRPSRVHGMWPALTGRETSVGTGRESCPSLDE
jgi:hypothetical protein